MSGETEKQVSGWTVDTLKEYTEQRFTDSDKAISAALQAAKEAVNKAEVANEKQFEAANNVKSTFSGELSKKLERTEYNSNHKALEDKIDALTDRMNRNDGKSTGLNAGWVLLTGAVGLIATTVLLLSRLK